MKVKKFRRTYLHLSELLPSLTRHTKSIKDERLFLSAFASFFLLEHPLFDHSAHAQNSIQTFYANHYLRDILKLHSLPFPDDLYSYCISNSFYKDINEVAKSTNLKIPLDDILCKEILPKTITPSIALQNLINYFIVSPKKSKYNITNLDYPSEEVFSELESKGFGVVNGFLDQKSLEQLKKITTIIANSEVKNGTGYFYGQPNGSQRIYNLIAKHPIFVDLISHPYMLNLMDRMFDRPTLHEKFGLCSHTGHIIAPGSKSIPLHIDSLVPDPIPPWMIRGVGVLALDDFTSNNGATAFVPGSHKFLRRPSPKDAALFKPEIVECKAGSLIIFDGAIWHHASANTSNKSRMGLMLSYAASFFMEICGDEEHLSVIPKETIKSFSPKMRQMIGYHRAIKKGAQDIDPKIYKEDLHKSD
jgi:hypothetical protein